MIKIRVIRTVDREKDRRGKISGAGKGSHWWESWNDGCLGKMGNHHCSATPLACSVKKPTQKTRVTWPVEVEGFDHYSHDDPVSGDVDRENFLLSAFRVSTTSRRVTDVGRECERTTSRRVQHGYRAVVINDLR